MEANKTKVNRKVNQKEKEKASPSPSEAGQQIQAEAVTQPIQDSPPELYAAPTVTTEEGEKVQAGHLEMALVQAQERERAIHPEYGAVFESNLTKYKGRKTEFLTIPMKLTQHQNYTFKGTARKTQVKITVTADGRRLIVEELH
jgi:hypothetical protein